MSPNCPGYPVTIRYAATIWRGSRGTSRIRTPTDSDTNGTETKDDIHEIMLCTRKMTCSNISPSRGIFCALAYSRQANTPAHNAMRRAGECQSGSPLSALIWRIDSRRELQRLAAAKRAGIQLKQTFAKEGKELRRRAGGYAHAKQFRRLRRVVKRQRTILGIVTREVQRKVEASGFVVEHPKALSDLTTLLERAERIRTQQRHDKNKLYALHAPEVECIGKGKARKPYEFGVKSAVVVTHKSGLMLGAKTFPGNPYDGHTLNAILQQSAKLTQDAGATLKQVVVDLGFRGVDADNPDKQIIHRGKIKSMSPQQKGWLRRRQAIEPAIGHLKSDNRMDRCWLQGALGDMLHTIGCAAGYNLRWLLRAIARLGIRAVFLRLLQSVVSAQVAIAATCGTRGRTWIQRTGVFVTGGTTILANELRWA